MFGERRKHQRYLINRIARILADSASHECIITDISERGARLFVDDKELLDQFDLIVSREASIRHPCRVIWRLGGEMGVEFASMQIDQSRLNAMAQIRADARQTFKARGRPA